MDNITDPNITLLTTVITELAKSGPLALILFILLREQMNKFDKFLVVLNALHDAFAKQTTALELLSHQCQTSQAEFRRQQDLEQLKKSLEAQRAELGLGGGSGDDGIAIL